MAAPGEAIQRSRAAVGINDAWSAVSGNRQVQS